MARDEIGYETRLARAEQSIEDLEEDLRALAPVIPELAMLVERVANMGQSFESLREELGKLVTGIAERDESQRRDRRQAQWAILSLTVTVVCAVIGALVVLASNGTLK